MEGWLLLLCHPQCRPIGDLLWSLFQLQGQRPSLATMYQTLRQALQEIKDRIGQDGDWLNVFGGGRNGGAGVPKKDQRD